CRAGLAMEKKKGKQEGEPRSLVCPPQRNTQAEDEGLPPFPSYGPEDIPRLMYLSDRFQDQLDLRGTVNELGSFSSHLTHPNDLKRSRNQGAVAPAMAGVAGDLYMHRGGGETGMSNLTMTSTAVSNRPMIPGEKFLYYHGLMPCTETEILDDIQKMKQVILPSLNTVSDQTAYRNSYNPSPQLTNTAVSNRPMIPGEKFLNNHGLMSCTETEIMNDIQKMKHGIRPNSNTVSDQTAYRNSLNHHPQSVGRMVHQAQNQGRYLGAAQFSKDFPRQVQNAGTASYTMQDVIDFSNLGQHAVGSFSGPAQNTSRFSNQLQNVDGYNDLMHNVDGVSGLAHNMGGFSHQTQNGYRFSGQPQNESSGNSSFHQIPGNHSLGVEIDRNAAFPSIAPNAGFHGIPAQPLPLMNHEQFGLSADGQYVDPGFRPARSMFRTAYQTTSDQLQNPVVGNVCNTSSQPSQFAPFTGADRISQQIRSGPYFRHSEVRAALAAEDGLLSKNTGIQLASPYFRDSEVSAALAADDGLLSKNTGHTSAEDGLLIRNSGMSSAGILVPPQTMLPIQPSIDLHRSLEVTSHRVPKLGKVTQASNIPSANSRKRGRVEHNLSTLIEVHNKATKTNPATSPSFTNVLHQTSISVAPVDQNTSTPDLINTAGKNLFPNALFSPPQMQPDHAGLAQSASSPNPKTALFSPPHAQSTPLLIRPAAPFYPSQAKTTATVPPFSHTGSRPYLPQNARPSTLRPPAPSTLDTVLRAQTTPAAPRTPRISFRPPASPRASPSYIKRQETDKTPQPSGRRCSICKIDLIYKPNRDDQSVNPPPVAVMACHHYYHDECLERITPKEQAQDPPCIACALKQK
ncbi:hypothetical protein Tsubulata_003429, partial [Turnera subulata]